jgi:hypothetical protein
VLDRLPQLFGKKARLAAPMSSIAIEFTRLGKHRLLAMFFDCIYQNNMPYAR